MTMNERSTTSGLKLQLITSNINKNLKKTQLTSKYGHDH